MARSGLSEAGCGGSAGRRGGWIDDWDLFTKWGQEFVLPGAHPSGLVTSLGEDRTVPRCGLTPHNPPPAISPSSDISAWSALSPQDPRLDEKACCVSQPAAALIHAPKPPGRDLRTGGLGGSGSRCGPFAPDTGLLVVSSLLQTEAQWQWREGTGRQGRALPDSQRGERKGTRPEVLVPSLLCWSQRSPWSKPLPLPGPQSPRA